MVGSADTALRDQSECDIESDKDEPRLQSLIVNTPIAPILFPDQSQEQEQWVGNMQSDTEHGQSDAQSPSSKVTDGSESLYSSSTFMLIDSSVSGDDES